MNPTGYGPSRCVYILTEILNFEKLNFSHTCRHWNWRARYCLPQMAV